MKTIAPFFDLFMLSHPWSGFRQLLPHKRRLTRYFFSMYNHERRASFAVEAYLRYSLVALGEVGEGLAGISGLLTQLSTKFHALRHDQLFFLANSVGMIIQCAEARVEHGTDHLVLFLAHNVCVEVKVVVEHKLTVVKGNFRSENLGTRKLVSDEEEHVLVCHRLAIQACIQEDGGTRSFCTVNDEVRVESIEQLPRHRFVYPQLGHHRVTLSVRTSPP